MAMFSWQICRHCLHGARSDMKKPAVSAIPAGSFLGIGARGSAFRRCPRSAQLLAFAPMVVYYHANNIANNIRNYQKLSKNIKDSSK